MVLEVSVVGKDAVCIFWETHIEGPADSEQGHAICSGETAPDMLLNPSRQSYLLGSVEAPKHFNWVAAAAVFPNK